MPETYLDYDKQIWTTFSVGVISSVVILYHVLCKKDLPQASPVLILGFSVLVYCFFLILGYGYKRSLLEKNLLSYKLSRRLYPRVRWMAEIIIIFIGIIYFFQFGQIFIPINILLLACLLCILSNICSFCKFKKSRWPNEKFLIADFFKKFFC